MKMKVLVLIFAMIVCAVHSQEMRMPQMQKMQSMMMKNMENDALLRMINELEITDEQMPQFISKFREMANLFRQQRENRDKIIEQLQKLISGQESDEKIGAKIAELERYSDRAYDDFKKFRNDMKTILKPEQQIKFFLMVDDIKNMLLSSPKMPAMSFQMMQMPLQGLQGQPPGPIPPLPPAMPNK